MINYVIINGVNSNTKTGLMINELPPITKPSMRTDTEEIDGRDGDIITKLGYSSYDKTITIGLWGTGYDVNSIISFFTSEGTITFSNEPDKYYKFTMVNEINVESLLRFKTASITFHCQPFKYPTNETPVEIEYEYVEQDNVESASMNNTEGETYLGISLKGNTSQTGTPTPSSPIPINVVSGDNTIKIEGKQLVNFQDTTKYLNQSGANLSSLETGIRATATASGTYRTGYYILDDLTNFLGKSFKIVATITPSASNTGSIRMFWFTGTSLNGEITPTDNVYNIPSTPVNNKIAILFYANLGGTGNIGDYVDYTNLMFISSTSSNDYVPYQSQTYPINLGELELCKIGTYQDYFTKNSGKNLINSVETHNGISNSGVIGADNTYLGITDYVSCKPSTTYTITFEHDKPNSSLYLGYKDENGTFINRTYQSGRTFTTPNNAYQLFAYVYDGNGFTIGGYVMLNEGTTALPYEPYGTGQWCKYNAIEKKVFDGSENWALWNIGNVNTQRFYIDFNTSGASDNNYLCDRFFYQASSNDVEHFRISNSTGYTYNEFVIFINRNRLSEVSVDGLKIWLAGNNLSVYRALATPYLSLIEDTTLISQLDNIQNAMSYEGTTNVSQINNDKPFLMDLKAMKKDTNEVTINNIGNATSKPLIELVGNGNIDIYLNGNQVLQANVDEKMNIDIDKLEAYNPDTSALLNRQVIGNYNSMTLQSGNNTIKMSGNLSTATISNFTRWI